MAVSKQELLWREWILGEGQFRDDPRNPARRAQTGAPAKVPRAWWERLEAFLARRHDKAEKPRESALPIPVRVPRANDAEQMSPHFRVREFDCKDGRKVPAVAVPALRRLCTVYLEPMRAAFGPCHVMSGYRPADYNRRIGGASLSQHIYELGPESVAADLIFRFGTPADWARLADQLGAGGVGRYPTFVHVDNRGGRARWSG